MDKHSLPAIAFLVYLVTFVLEGPLRAGLDILGLGAAIYLRDALIAFFVVWALVLGPPWISQKLRLVLWVIVEIILLHSLWGYAQLGNIFQVGFGLKLFLPALFGIACAEEFLRTLDRYWKAYFIFLVICISGILINYFVKMPWAGKEYEIAGVAIRGTKEWYAGSLRRLYGFGRASGTVAVQLQLFWCIAYCYSSRKVLWLLTPLTVLAIFLTTTKGIWLAFTAVVTYLVLRRLTKSESFFRLAYLLLWPVLCVVIPLFFFVVDAPKITELTGVTRFLFGSFVERGSYMWPTLADMLWKEGTLITGRGVGGIGTPQLLFEYSKYNPADNFFMYWWGVFGVLGFVYFLILLLGVGRLQLSSDLVPNKVFLGLLCISFFVYGMTTYVLEGGEFACLGGVLIAKLYAGYSRESPASAMRKVRTVNS